MLQQPHTSDLSIADRLSRPRTWAAIAAFVAGALCLPAASAAQNRSPSAPPSTQPATQPAATSAAQERIWAQQWDQFRLRLSPTHDDQSTPAGGLNFAIDPPADQTREQNPAAVPFDFSSWTGRSLLSWDEELSHTSANSEAGLTELVPADELKDGTISLTVNQTRIIRTTRPYYRVSVAAPDIADVTPLAPDALMLTTKSTGNTQLVLWDENERTQTLLVRSEADLREINEKFEQLLPDENVEVVDLRGRIALRGRVSNVEAAERALQIAEAYSEDVVDFLEVNGNQQVMLEIRFAEVSRTAGKQLGFNFGIVGQDGSGASNIGNINPFNPGLTAGGNIDPTNLSVAERTSPAVTLFGGGVVGDVAFEAFLAALRENNLLRVLAEPNLTLLSGQEGQFLAGGEIPIPVPQGDETLTIEYKSFGIKLRALPVVMGDGRIRVRVEPEVSDIDPSTGVSVGGVAVPGFRVRQLSTEVELVSGQTFVLAGLLDSSVTANKQVTPLLGDIPVLGALFRSTRYQRRETELVVLITPRLVSPLDPDEVPALPGQNWKHPSDYQLFLLGEMGGEAGVRTPHQGDVGNADNAATRRNAPKAEPRLEATYSFLPAEPAQNR